MLNVQPFTADEKAEIDAEGYFAALRALERAERGAKGLSRTDISTRSGLAKATVSRVLNGTAKNITLRTLFVLARAMNHKIRILPLSLADAYLKASNFNFAPPKISTVDAGSMTLAIASNASAVSSGVYAAN